MAIVKIYTDGACSGNQNDTNLGGWGSVLEYGEHKKELFAGEVNTTNNRMELSAVIAAFRALKRDGLEIQVFSDSSYVVNCFRMGWYKNWVKNGWKTAAKKPVENRELWEELLSLVSKHDVSFFLVKGHVSPDSDEEKLRKVYERFKEHNGNRFSFEEFKYITEMNNRADELANRGIDSVRPAEAE